MGKLKKIIKKKFYAGVKSIYQKTIPQSSNLKNILFVLGCQRSGTTLMADLFDKDLIVKVYGEISKLSNLDMVNKIRLNSYDIVRKEIDRNRVSSIVLKPLVESQNTNKLLAYFKESRGLWMFRHYKSVASSNLKKFGLQNGINDLRPIVNKTAGNWRSESVSQSTFELVLKHFSEDMPPHDAAALFWYVRNMIFFDLNLQKNHRIMMCKYEDLVCSPLSTMELVYSFSRFEFPGEKIVADVHSKSVNKGQSVSLSPEIEILCDNMMKKLNAAYATPKYNS